MAAQPQPQVSPLIGTLKTFGEFGPMYEVIGAAPSSAEGAEHVTIRVFGTDEVLDYPVGEFLADPEAV